MVQSHYKTSSQCLFLTTNFVIYNSNTCVPLRRLATIVWLSYHLAEKGAHTCHKSANIWKALWGLSHHENNTTTSNITFDNTKCFFLPKECGNFFHLMRKKLGYLYLKDFLKYEYTLYFKQPLTPPQRKIIVAYHTLDHTLAIGIGCWSTISISKKY